jgi:hypothetical protein
MHSRFFSCLLVLITIIVLYQFLLLRTYSSVRSLAYLPVRSMLKHWRLFHLFFLDCRRLGAYIHGFRISYFKNWHVSWNLMSMVGIEVLVHYWMFWRFAWCSVGLSFQNSLHRYTFFASLCELVGDYLGLQVKENRSRVLIHAFMIKLASTIVIYLKICRLAVLCLNL